MIFVDQYIVTVLSGVAFMVLACLGDLPVPGHCPDNFSLPGYDLQKCFSVVLNLHTSNCLSFLSQVYQLAQFFCFSSLN